MKKIKLWEYILDKISSNKNVVLLIVANASNGSPGKTGFKMAIANDSTTIGTIGGGVMEFNIITELNNAFLNNQEMICVRKLHHNNLASGEKSGLICGGVQTIVFKTLKLENIETVKQIIANLKVMEYGVLSITNTSFSFSSKKKNSDEFLLLNEKNDNWIFEENIGLPNTVYIIGGGHVGLAVSRIMATLDFYVVIFDHRKDVQTMSENIFAHKKIITTYDQIANYIISGDKSYVIVVTPNHDGDKDALFSVINMDLKYIGSMGSKKKTASIFSQLKAKGIEDHLLKNIHTPIGLEIEAESPEEIAISIAAEIIQIKNS